jgi:DNA replication and repair protein RecF
MIRRSAESCVATVEAVSDVDVDYRVSVEIREGQRKRIASTHGSNLSPRDILGVMPIVALSPDHKSITFGGPSDRRSFLDAVMAQSSKTVTGLLYELKRVLKQRNALLQSASSEQRTASSQVPGTWHMALGTWTSEFITISAALIARRAAFIADLAPIVQEEYARVSGEAEEIEIVYQPDHVDLAMGDVVGQLQATAERLATAVRAREVTLFGPQKDEITFLINGGLVRETASQGQHKSLLVALKLAEARLLMERRHERPIMLLDDVFSELDADRSAHVLDRILEMGMQCFVTTTDGERIAAMTRKDVVVVEVSNGTIHSVAA